MLPIGPLAVSEIDSSKNERLKAFAGNVNRYNQISMNKRATLSQKSLALHEVMFSAGGYLTSKPPQEKKLKNIRRWKAIEFVARECGREAERLNIRLVRGPTDMRQVNGNKVNIWLEVIDPAHRLAEALCDPFAK